MPLWYTLPVIGYSEASRDLNLDEGESNTLTVEVIKPAPGLTAPQLIVAFQIDNTANTGTVTAVVVIHSVITYIHVYIYCMCLNFQHVICFFR